VGDGVIGADHEPGHGGQGGADEEGEGNDVVHIYPHELGDLGIFRRGPHGPAQAGTVNEQEQAPHHGRRRHHDKHLQIAEGGPQDQMLAGGKNGGKSVVIPAPDHHGQVLQDDGDADGGDQGRQSGRLAQGPVGDAFHQVAHHHAHRDGGGQTDQGPDGAGQAGIGQQVDDREGGEGADHDHFPVGEVDQAHDAVHHGVAQGHQGVDAPQNQAVDDLLQKDVHDSWA